MGYMNYGATSEMAGLSAAIHDNVSIVQNYCKSNDLEIPSFSVASPSGAQVFKSNPEVFEAYSKALEASRELHFLLQGGAEIIRSLNTNDIAALAVIYRFRIAQAFPSDEEVSFEELSSRCNVPLVELRIILRYAMTNYIFRESREGVVAHTPASQQLAGSKVLDDFVGVMCEERLPASTKIVEALEKYPDSQEPSLSGWGIANDASSGMFEELSKYPSRSQRFADAMDSMASWTPTQPLIDNYPWNDLQENALVVDVGGGHGPVSIALARQFPHLRFVVQDLEGSAIEGRKKLPSELRDRVQFQAHNIFDEQPLRDASVFLLRAVLHDWPDKYCVKILRQLIPAMKKGTRIILNEFCTPSPGKMPPLIEKRFRNRDMNFLHLFNSRDRAEEDWKFILEKADPRFVYKGIKQPVVGDKRGYSPETFFSIIEAVWEE